MDSLMADHAGQKPQAADAVRPQALMAAFRQVGLPLLQALAETPEADDPKPEAFNGKKFAALVDSAVALSRELAARLDEKETWALAGAASQIAAASFKATGEPLSAEEAHKLAGNLLELQARFQESLPDNSEPSPATAAAFRVRMMEAMVPVIGAVAQYAFGRPEHLLLAEIAERLLKTTDQATRTLAPPGAKPGEWRLLYWNILRAAGQVYAESHYAEADRLLYMKPDERTAYFTQHGNMPPLAPVWQIFNQRMAMLATLAAYLEVPADAQLDAEGWKP